MSTQSPPLGDGSDLASTPISGSVVPGGTRAFWGLAIVGAVVAGVGSWLVVEAVLSSYQPVFNSASRPYPTAEDMVRITQARVDSGTIGFGTTGALVGLALGLVGGGSRRSIRAGALAGGVGLMVGGLLEAGVARLALRFIYTRIDLQSDDMLQTLLSHEALWATVGLVGGGALGLGRGGRGAWWRLALGGLVGASVATVGYEFIGALAFATHGTQQPYGDSTITRLLAQVMIPLGTALGAVGMASEKRLATEPSPP